MKKFNRILALILTLVTVFAMLPATVVASESWLDVSGKNDGTASTVTVTLDAEQLLAVLKGGVSASTVKEVLANISVKGLSQVISVEELFEIVPSETWANVLKLEDVMLGLDKATLEELMDSILANEAELDAIVHELDVTVLAEELLAKLNVVTNLSEIVDLSGLALSGLIELEDVVRTDKVADAVDALGDDVVSAYVSNTPAEGYIRVEAGRYVDILGLNNDESIDFTLSSDMIKETAAKKALKDVDAVELTHYIKDKKAILDLMDDVAAVKLLCEHPGFISLLGTDTLVELLGKIDLASYITADTFVPVIERIKANVKNIHLAGQEIAVSNPDTGLGLNLQNLVRALPSLLITLGDVANTADGKLKTVNFSFNYTPNGTTELKTKNINLELALGGNIERVKAAAAKLSAIIDSIFRFEIKPDGTVSLYLNIPSVAADVVKTLLNTSDISEETLSKLLHFGGNGTADATPENAVLFIENLTFDELLEVLGGLDLDALYSFVMNQSYVKAVLNKVGYTNVGSLDGLANALVNLSVEDVCDKVSGFVKRDVMALLEKAAPKLDGLTDNEKVEKLLALVTEKTGFDVSDLKPSELLETYKGVPVFEIVSNVIAEKVGVNVKEVIESEGITGIYEMAVEKAESFSDAFETIQSKVGGLSDALPEGILSLNIADFYKGNGTFAASRYLNIDPKALLDKVADKLPAKVSEILTVLGIQDMAPISLNLDATLHVSGLYRITYMDQSGEAVLLNVFLPAGTNLEIFRNDASITAGYEFTGWYDEEGNELKEMPARDCVVRADLEASIIKFVDSEGTLIGMIATDGILNSKYRDQIAEVEAAALNFVPPTADPNQYLDSGYYWYMKGDEAKTPVELKNLIGSMVLVMEVTPNYFISVNEGLLVDRACNGRTHTITVLNDSFKEIRITMSVDNFLEFAKDKKTSLVVSIRGEYDLVDISNKVMVQLYEAAVAARASSVTFVYTPNGTKAGDFKNTYFDGAESAEFHEFKIFFGTNEKKEFGDLFDGALDITLPYNTLVNVSGARTGVYVMGSAGKEEITAVAKKNYISFKAPHFSDYVLVNEYLVKQTVVNADGTAVEVTNTDFPLNSYYPAGTVIPMNFIIGRNGSEEAAYAIDSITSSDASALANGKLTVPAKSVTITVTLKGRPFYIYYYVNGNLFKTQTYTTNDYIKGQAGDAASKLLYQCIDFSEDVLALMPAGYEGGEWVGHNATQAGKGDMYVYAVWTPKSYTIEFKDAVSYVFTVENYNYVIATPAVPASKDPALAGVWKNWTGVDAYDWDAFFAGTETKLVIEAEYVARSFNVVSDGLETFEVDGAILEGKEFLLAAGTKVYVEAFGKKHQVGSVRIYTIQGDRVNVDEEGYFTMPASPITVSVTYTNKRYNYTINGGESLVGFGNQYTNFKIELPAGQFITQMSKGCVLTAVEDAANGAKLLTYSFVLTEDNQAITYALGTSPSGLIYVVNGALTDGKAPEDETFDKWSVFNANGSVLNFAGFVTNELVRSLLWLWIVLAIVLLIVLITVLYRLYINGKLKPNFFLRFIAWIVSGFYAVCLGVAALGLGLLHLFGKDKYEERDYVPNPEDDSDETDEDAVEAVADASEEATEEATEEAVEEAAEETTEEVAEEATEKAAEDADEDEESKKK